MKQLIVAMFVVLLVTPLYANQYKIVGTNEQGTTSILYCAPEIGTSQPLFCFDYFNHDPSLVVGTKFTHVATHYGWTLNGVRVKATCVKDGIHIDHPLNCVLT